MKEKTPKLNIVFVCTGNTCRSPMAEHLFKSLLKSKKQMLKYSVQSAGTFAADGDPMTAEAAKTLAHLGIKIAKPHKAKRVTVDIIQNADLIICMTATHKNAILEMPTYMYASGDGKKRMVLSLSDIAEYDVQDPYMGSLEVYLAAANQIKDALLAVYELAETERAKKPTLNF